MKGPELIYSGPFIMRDEIISFIILPAYYAFFTFGKRVGILGENDEIYTVSFLSSNTITGAGVFYGEVILEG